MIDYVIEPEDRLVEQDDVYWTVLEDLSEPEQTYLQTALKDGHLDYWAHPSDRPERTRTALDYEDTLTLLVGDEGHGIIGYDTTFAVTKERLGEMYSTPVTERLAPFTAEDTGLVYHMVLHPSFRGDGYGIKTACLRQHILERDWKATGEDTPNAYYQAMNTDQQEDTFLAQVQQVEGDYLSPDTVISFPRRYETPEDRESNTLSRAYRISQGFGFDTCDHLLNGGNDTFIVRTTPESEDTLCVLDPIDDSYIQGER